MSSNPKQHNPSQPMMLVEDSDDDYEATRRALKKAHLSNPVVRFDSGQGGVGLFR